MKKYIVIFGLTFSSYLIAATCTPAPFLKNGVDFDQFRQCKQLMNQCPKNGIYPDSQCVSEQLKNDSCSQFEQLSSITGNNPSFTNVYRVKNVTLVQNFTPADGQNHYFMIDSQGCIVSAAVSPQQITGDASAENLMTLETMKPVIYQNPDGTSVMSFRLGVSACVACERTQFTTAQFGFDSDGKYNGVKLQD